MKPKHLAAISLAALVTSSCAAAIRVDTDRRATPKLADYHTYFLLQGHSSGDPAVDQRIRSDLSVAFAGHGWLEVPRNEADAVVVIHAATGAAHSDAAFYEGWGGWDWRQAHEATPGLDGPYKVGSIVIDIFDARTKHAIWRGVATDALGDNRPREAHLTQAAVAKLFKSFPNIESTGDGQPPAVPIDGALPRITFAQSPAVLITVDGDPVYRLIHGTDLWRVVNTKAFIVRDDSGIHYLRLDGRWMQAYTLTGWWSPAGTVPDGTEAALNQAMSAKAVDVTDHGESNPPDDVETGIIPTVYVTTTPSS